jgi:hypothetical protein
MTLVTRLVVRWTACLSIMLAASLALPPGAEARKDKRPQATSKSYGYTASRRSSRAAYGYQPGYSYQPGSPSPQDSSDSMDCIRARDADPGGNYSGYPCWAQWALSPKGREH